MRRQLVALALIFTVAAAVAGCEKRNEFVQPPPPIVTVAKPIVRSVADTIEFTGTTRATATVDLRPRVNGYLRQVKFQDGQIVQKGDLLFVIEQEPFELRVAAAKARQQSAEASLQLAKANLARTQELFRQRVVQQQELDVQQAQFATATANVAVAAADVKQADLQLSYTEITAPITGRIGRHLVDEGNLVAAEETRLATIESIDPIYAYFQVSETDLLRFREMLRQNKLPDPEAQPPVLHMALANEEDFPHKGHLDFRELGVDSSTGTATRRGRFPNPNNVLIPGLFVRIRATIGEPTPQVLVEERAIGSDQRGDFVLTVNGQNVVEYRPVVLGPEVDSWRVVVQGIPADSQVVVNGLQRARPGGEVRPEPLPASEYPPPPSGLGVGESAPESEPLAVRPTESE